MDSKTKLVCGWHLPYSDEHFQKMLLKYYKQKGKYEYQYDHRKTALKHVKNKRVAIDCGGHVGLWSVDLCKQFNHVIAFEPSKLMAECFELNMKDRGLTNYTLIREALGNHQGFISLNVEKENSGNSFVLPNKGGSIPLTTLDLVLGVVESWFDKQHEIDFIKLDLEGYEKFALEGMRETLIKYKPVLNVELKDHGSRYGNSKQDIINYLFDLNYRILDRTSDDYVFGT